MEQFQQRRYYRRAFFKVLNCAATTSVSRYPSHCPRVPRSLYWLIQTRQAVYKMLCPCKGPAVQYGPRTNFEVDFEPSGANMKTTCGSMSCSAVNPNLGIKCGAANTSGYQVRDTGASYFEQIIKAGTPGKDPSSTRMLLAAGIEPDQ